MKTDKIPSHVANLRKSKDQRLRLNKLKDDNTAKMLNENKNRENQGQEIEYDKGTNKKTNHETEQKITKNRH